MGIASINPVTGATLQTFEPLSPAGLEDKLEQAWQAFHNYRHTSLAQRATWLNQAAGLLEADKQVWAQLITLEMGKTLASAVAEVEKSAVVCRYYATHGPEFLAPAAGPADLLPDGRVALTHTRYDPLGPVLAVMPWNFPFWQVFRFAAPVLMVGNVGLLKHASNVPQCALGIAEILQKAGFPEGVFQTLLIEGARVPDLLADPRIVAATLTGSEPAGISLATAAGRHLKKVVLELGGSDPFIVLESADLEAAIATAVTARLISNGQSCIAAKRFIVAEAIADAFEAGFLARFQRLRLGDPCDPATEVGPLATASIRAELHEQVQTVIRQGAACRCGGELPPGPGYFYPPTLITQIPPGTIADSDEFFGPVALMFRVASLDEAIAKANASPFGLGASAWTRDPAEQARLVQDLEAGAVFINGMTRSDPRFPFGGIKRSGYGRELGRPGIYEFVNIKSTWVNPSP
ncbi:MAG: NAD-dependent succinate-semialdehyde dehydrogenase [Gloeomargaritaceae cyanobacterium C42_A2020_066]|nr:NAD-dependent succinate-semialdehyde dehydrogenase [Gloeomargaritaceae cyanobacterium C42_A2020_066]